MRGLPQGHARDRAESAHVHRVSRSARHEDTCRLQQLSREAGPASGDAARRVHRLSPPARDASDVRLVSSDRASSRGEHAVPRLPHAARREAACNRCAVREVPCRSRETCRRPRRVPHVPPECCAHAEQEHARMRELPSARGDIRAEGPSNVRELPPAARAREDARMRELPHAGGEDEARCARLRDVSSPPRAEGRRDASVLRELSPRSIGEERRTRAARPARFEGARRLRPVSHVPRGETEGRPRELPRVSSRAAEPRAERSALRDVPPVPLANDQLGTRTWAPSARSGRRRLPCQSAIESANNRTCVQSVSTWSRVVSVGWP